MRKSISDALTLKAAELATTHDQRLAASAAHRAAAAQAERDADTAAKHHVAVKNALGILKDAGVNL